MVLCIGARISFQSIQSLAVKGPSQKIDSSKGSPSRLESEANIYSSFHGMISENCANVTNQRIRSCSNHKITTSYGNHFTIINS